MLMTSAKINRLIKSLQSEFELCQRLEKDSMVVDTSYVPVNIRKARQECDYPFDKSNIEQNNLQKKLCILRHALNVHNSTVPIKIEGQVYTADQLLYQIQWLRQRQTELNEMRLPQIKRDEVFIYDLKAVQAEYKKVSKRLIILQSALEKFNHTVEFNVEY